MATTRGGRTSHLSALLRTPAFASLPVVEHLDEIRAALPGRRVVVQAPPGTGKTTAVPPLLAAGTSARVVVTQPRRIAARSAARRLAALTGTRPGEYAAHTVRGESTLGGGSAVEFVTTGVLLRRLLHDPSLEGVDAVVLDEVHERHLDDDLAVAMLADLAVLREDLTVVAMSATLDAARWADLLGGAAVVAVPSVLHPLEIRWAPPPTPATDGRGVSPAFLDHVAATTRDVAREEPERSVLVFVPGVREVEHVVGGLAGLGRPVQPLHGRLSPRQQEEALRDEGPPRVVVATAVAESSLTVPGVRVVVDSCLSREPRFDQQRGVSGLVTVRSARASATQRAGRAARLGPGIAVRCMPSEAWAGMAEEALPESAHADLTGALLALACWGAPRGDGMALPSPLSEAGVRRAEEELRQLGLVDDGGAATSLGRRVAEIPTEPRLAAALLSGAGRVGVRKAAEAVALLAADDLPDADLTSALAELRRSETPAARRWRDETTRLARAIREVPGDAAEAGDREALAWIVASARPGWISRRRSERTYVSASGTGLELPRGSASGPPWLAVWESQRAAAKAESIVRAAVPIDESLALEAGAHLLSEGVETSWDDGRVRARIVRRLGAIVLSSTPTRPGLADAEAAVRDALAERGIAAVLGWSRSAASLRRRLAVLHRSHPSWPDVRDEALEAAADEWLLPEILAAARGGGVDLTGALRRLLPWRDASRLDELAPERIRVPSGSSITLDYPEVGSDEPVVLAVKLQECFGWTRTPQICDGRERILLHLLSPAGRPLAVTEDLASFWANVYPSVRAENRGRYAKHPWPEDPLTAKAMRGTTRSGR